MDHRKNMDNKSKPVTTSVPSIAIKFHANAEQIEELYGSDEETSDKPNTSESESSPLKYFPRLVKRSTSIDVSSNQPPIDSSPPSDPWRFFSDIRGKITKSVEEKITEIKTRNQEGDASSSPAHKSKPTKDSKENSSRSDSEELSESSISRTCGIVSTTEGVEMSSDDDTPSLDKDKEKKMFSNTLTAPSSLRQRFRMLKHKSCKEGSVSVNNLSKLYNINAEKKEQTLPEDNVEEVEDGIDVLEDSDLNTTKTRITSEEIVDCVSKRFDNIEIDKTDNLLNIREISGRELSGLIDDQVHTVFAPTGFVHLRPKTVKNSTSRSFYSLTSIYLLIYAILHYYLPYLAGLMVGIVLTYCIMRVYLKFWVIATNPVGAGVVTVENKSILEIPAVKEYQPIVKYEGWMNEYPDVYNPQLYHISQTQSVFIRLQGNLLRLSHSKTKISKRGMWNEGEIKPNFTHHRTYNLLNAKIILLPDGLAKKRHWSKKYPICIVLNKDQMNFDPEILSKFDSEEDKEEKTPLAHKVQKSGGLLKEKRAFYFKRSPIRQRFSKLAEDDEDFELESDSRASSPSLDVSDAPIENASAHDANEDDLNSLNDEWSNCSPEDSPTELKLYLFGRTDREKEDWFRRLMAATHKTSPLNDSLDLEGSEMEKNAILMNDYMKYMLNYVKTQKKDSQEDVDKETNESGEQSYVLWLNALVGRVLFDCMRDPMFTQRVRERIQRKLAAIKLPYFIEELLVTELSLGKTAPIVQRTGRPSMDERGLWVDLDLTYDGLVVLILQTKINLMKLKNPHANEMPIGEVRSAMFHSDVDDSAESSSDEDGGSQEIQYASSMDSLNSSTTGMSGSSNSSKKFIKMVDRIAESRLFQKAAETKLIKKAMEGVSNTELRLKVEVRGLFGCLVLNMPPPPSDRIWVGFKPTPELLLSAHPIVGERNISFLMVTSWIEKKLVQEFQKIMVIPNMEDFIIPVMNPKLPE